MKTKLLILVLTAAALFAIFTISSSATYWDDNPFTDVASDSWYYESVRFCKTNGLFAGTGADTFAPGAKMTRAMLVTVLASADGYDRDEYARPAFDDVPADAWYYTAVCWAKENGVTGGMGDGIFAPDVEISREQAALMLRKYAMLRGLDETSAEADLSVFEDSDSISAWATDALSWAKEKGIMTGVSSSPMLIAPKNAADRAAFSVMLRKLFALKPSYTINGNDISLYSIVVPANPSKQVEEAASRLQLTVKETTGITLPLKWDTAESEYEILIGRVDRDVAEADYADLNDTAYAWHIDGDTLIFECKNRAYNDREVRYAVYDFCENILGASFYTDDLILYDTDPLIALKDGDGKTAQYGFEQRVVYWDNGWQKVYLNDETSMYGLPHQMGNFVYRHLNKPNDSTNDNPCMTDPENIASLINNMRKLMTERPDVRTLHIVQNDTWGYCTCENCMQVYREEGSRCGTIIRALNALSEALTPEFPELEIYTWAYEYSIRPPQKTVLADNISLYFNSIIFCASHAYSDPDCRDNRLFYTYLDEWRKATRHLYVWDHSTDFFYLLTPFTDLDVLRQNTNDFWEHGVQGVFNNAVSEKMGEFGELRAFLFTRLYREPWMDQDKYDYFKRGFMRAYYGKGYASLLEYLDIIAESHKDHHFQFAPAPSGTMDYEKMADKTDRINALWDKAMAAAGDDAQREHIECSRLSATYIVQNILYKPEYVNGTEEQREAYVERSKAFHKIVEKYGVQWNEKTNVVAAAYELPPEAWNSGIDEIEENAPIAVPSAAPVVDGIIGENEGYSAKGVLNEKTSACFLNYNPETSTGEFAFAHSDKGLYFAATFTEKHFEGNAFCYSTGADDIDGRYSFNGDVITLALDPYAMLAHSCFAHDYAPWYNIALFEDGTAKLGRTKTDDAILTDDPTSGVEVAAKLLEQNNNGIDKWSVEVFIPWTVIANDIESVSFGAVKLDPAELAKSGSEITASVTYMDRFVDPESDEMDNWGRWITVADIGSDGARSTVTNGDNVRSMGLKLVIGN